MNQSPPHAPWREVVRAEAAALEQRLRTYSDRESVIVCGMVNGEFVAHMRIHDEVKTMLSALRAWCDSMECSLTDDAPPPASEPEQP